MRQTWFLVLATATRTLCLSALSLSISSSSPASSADFGRPPPTPFPCLRGAGILFWKCKKNEERIQFLVNVLCCAPSGALPRCGLKVSRCSCCQREIERSNTYMNGIGFIWLCIWQCFGIMWHVGPRLWISEIIGLKYITKNSQKRDHSIAIYSIFWIGMVYFGYHLVKAHVQTVQNMYGKGG